MRGADVATVERALRAGDPLPGTAGFAGALPDGRLVRDALGRELVYSEADDPGSWAYHPGGLDDPDLVPAGHLRADDGDREVWTLPAPEPFADDDRAVARLREAVTASVDAAVGAAPTDDTPVAFSGGVDSGILAARGGGPLYVAGFEDSHDLDAARSAAAAMERELTAIELDHDDLRRAVPRVAHATGRTNAMDVGIAVPLFLVAEHAADAGHERLVVGQGTDELFGGYAKVARAPDDPRVDADTVLGATREVVRSLPVQLERDLLAVRAAGVEPVAPLVHDRVVDVALRLPGHLLAAGDRRKVALRRAVDFLPDDVRYREKKAVQYGSYVARELDRLARQDGFKRRMDDHVTRYVESLL
jgi:asparagine synthase (glutamine-hydrolysing)